MIDDLVNLWQARFQSARNAGRDFRIGRKARLWFCGGSLATKKHKRPQKRKGDFTTEIAKIAESGSGTFNHRWTLIDTDSYRRQRRELRSWPRESTLRRWEAMAGQAKGHKMEGEFLTTDHRHLNVGAGGHGLTRIGGRLFVSRKGTQRAQRLGWELLTAKYARYVKKERLLQCEKLQGYK